MGKVMNIYGVMVEDTGYGETIKKFREIKPDFHFAVTIEEWVRNLLENNDEDFYLYIHKTKTENVLPILYQGLKIFESGGSIESTMSRCFDSTSIDIEGDINYLLNTIRTSNQYGSCSVVAIIPKEYKKCYEMVHQTSMPTVPKEALAFGVNEFGYLIQGQAFKMGEIKEKTSKAK